MTEPQRRPAQQHRAPTGTLKGTPPTISVVTLAWNSAATIEQTLQSVVSQTYPLVDYVVVDGGSTDGTTEILSRFGPRLSAWISEPDEGISHAMNKGVGLCRGDFLLFLHSDDFLVSENALETAVAAMGTCGADIYAFDIYFRSNAGDRRMSPRRFDWRMRFKGLPHQGVLCRRSLFGKIGLFDLSLKICLDYDFFLRAYLAGAAAERVPLALSVMRDTGISSRRDWRSLRRRFSEEKRVHRRYATTLAMRAMYNIYWPLYLTYRRMRTVL